MNKQKSLPRGLSLLSLPEVARTKSPIVLLLHLDSERHFQARSEPIGIEQLGASAQTNSRVTLGRIKKVEDLYFFLPEEIKFPDIIGLSLPLGSLELAEDMFNKLNILKEERSVDPLIIVGGYIPTWMSKDQIDLFLRSHKNTLVVKSGGDNPLIQIIERFKKGDSFTDIPGVTFVNKEGEIETTLPNIEFNSILSPRTTPHVLNDGQTDIGGVVGSRGCDYNACSFCTRPPEDVGSNVIKHWIARDPEVYIKELKALYRFKTETGNRMPIFFPDEEYLVAGDLEPIRQRIILWQEALLREGNKPEGEKELDVMDFETSMRADTVTKIIESGNIEVLRSLVGLGWRRVFLGFESAIPGNYKRWDNLNIPGQLKRYCKGSTSEQQLIGIRHLEKLGVDIELGTIFFDPLLDLGELYENLDFIKINRLVSYAYTPFSELRIQQGSKSIKTMSALLDKIGKPTEIFREYNPSTMSTSYNYFHPLIQKISEVIRSVNEETYKAKRVLKQAMRGGAFSGYKCEENLGLMTLNQLAECDVNFCLSLIDMAVEELNRRGIETTNYDEIAEDFFTLVNSFGILENYRNMRDRIWLDYLESAEGVYIEEIKSYLRVIN